MGDQRVVGHAIRRRQGNASSHLGMARPPGSWTPPVGSIPSAEATAGSNVGVYQGGGRSMSSGHKKGVPDTYETGTGSTGGGTSARNIVSDSSAFASSVSASAMNEPHPSRSRVGPEAAGSRLTVSPSMKIPTESPVPTQGGGMTVPSIGSRTGSFGAGQSEAGMG